MAWTAPRTWVAGEIVTAALMNTHIRDNERYLKGLDGAITLSDALILPDGAGYYLHISILTTVQRDALTPTAGMIIYNSTTTQFNKYENGAWRADLGFNSDHGGFGGLGDDDHTQYVLESLLTTQGDLPYATAASTWTRLAKGTADQFLRMNAGATAPEWDTISILAKLLAFNGTNVAIGATAYLPTGTGATSASETKDYQWMIPVAGTLKTLYVAVTTSSGSNTGDIFTVRVNGVNTSITCTLIQSATTGNDTTNTAAVVVGDLVSVRCVVAGDANATGAIAVGLILE